MQSHTNAPSTASPTTVTTLFESGQELADCYAAIRLAELAGVPNLSALRHTLALSGQAAGLDLDAALETTKVKVGDYLTPDA